VVAPAQSATTAPEPEAKRPEPEPESEPEPEPEHEPVPETRPESPELEPIPEPGPEPEPEPELTQSLTENTSTSTTEATGPAPARPPQEPPASATAPKPETDAGEPDPSESPVPTHELTEATSGVEDADPTPSHTTSTEPDATPSTNKTSDFKATPPDRALQPAEKAAESRSDTTVLRNRHETTRQHTRNFLMSFLATIIVGLVAYTFWIELWSWPFNSDASRGCARGTSAATVAPIKQTSVHVYNTTARRGLALSIARELQKRGFTVPMWDNDTGSPEMTTAAEIRHGPDGLLPARTIATQVNGSTVLVLEPERRGPTVDLVLGQAFTGLNSPEKATELMAPPPATANTCDNN
jgi:hypothetical protein